MMVTTRPRSSRVSESEAAADETTVLTLQFDTSLADKRVLVTDFAQSCDTTSATTHQPSLHEVTPPVLEATTQRYLASSTAAGTLVHDQPNVVCLLDADARLYVNCGLDVGAAADNAVACFVEFEVVEAAL